MVNVLQLHHDWMWAIWLSFVPDCAHLNLIWIVAASQTCVVANRLLLALGMPYIVGVMPLEYDSHFAAAKVEPYG